MQKWFENGVFIYLFSVNLNKTNEKKIWREKGKRKNGKLNTMLIEIFNGMIFKSNVRVSIIAHAVYIEPTELRNAQFFYFHS